MGIAPIDLQAIYANMNNVAKVASVQQQGVQLAQQLQESKIIQQNAEKAKSVHKTADNEAKSGVIKNEGHASQGYAESRKNKNQKEIDKDESLSKKPMEIREDYLGQHINIER